MRSDRCRDDFCCYFPETAEGITRGILPRYHGRLSEESLSLLLQFQSPPLARASAGVLSAARAARLSASPETSATGEQVWLRVVFIIVSLLRSIGLLTSPTRSHPAARSWRISARALA